MEEEEEIFVEMAKYEDLGNKLPEKFKFPQQDLIYLCENYSKFFGCIY